MIIGSRRIPINRAPVESLLRKDLLEEDSAVHFGLLVTCDREVALDTDFLALLLEQTPETGVVYAIPLDHGHGCGLAVPYPDGRIVLGNVSEG